ncbi:hypothetical protein DSECCO2_403430 [anaerobic digester metagenome]
MWSARVSSSSMRMSEKRLFLRANVTRISISLAGPASPRAYEPKIAIHSASFLVSIATMVSRTVLVNVHPTILTVPVCWLV